MRLAFDARDRRKPHSSYARTLSLLQESARAVGLEAEEWTDGPCGAEVLWSPQRKPAPVRGPRQVLTVHDINPLVPGTRGRLARIRRELGFRLSMRRTRRRAWRLATDSEDAARRLRQAFPGPGPRLGVVPLYASSRFRPGPPPAALLERLGLAPGYLLFVGALRRHKNWELLLQAYARLPASLQRSRPLVLAGPPRRQETRAQRLAKALGIEGKVRLPGILGDEDLAGLLRGAGLFLFPSLAEGFGLPPLEALASGVPVLSSDRTSLPEVLGPAARYADPTDPADWARALEALLADPGSLAELGAAGPAWAARYGPERTGRAMLSLLEEGED